MGKRQSSEADFKVKTVTGMTNNQKTYIRNIKEHIYNFAVGPAGTGKTHVAIGMAVQAIRREETERIVISRPTVGVGEGLGFLPGNIDEKVAPYVVPCFDELHYYVSHSAITRWKNEKKIINVPLPFMRGRTFHDAYMILDEAQNATYEEIKTFLTRVGLNTKVVVTGDPDQSDLPKHKQGGLREVIERLYDMPMFSGSVLTIEDIVRSEHGHEIVSRL